MLTVKFSDGTAYGVESVRQNVNDVDNHKTILLITPSSASDFDEMSLSAEKGGSIELLDVDSVVDTFTGFSFLNATKQYRMNDGGAVLECNVTLEKEVQ